MDVQIDEARRKIVASKIQRLGGSVCAWPDRRDFAVARFNLQPFPKSIGEN